MKKTEQIRHLVLRVPKDQAAFVYFQLESNEGLFFYSTLDESLKEAFRDLELFSPTSLENEGNHFLEHLKTEVEYLVLADEILEDSRDLAHLNSKFGKKGGPKE